VWRHAAWAAIWPSIGVVAGNAILKPQDLVSAQFFGGRIFNEVVRRDLICGGRQPSLERIPSVMNAVESFINDASHSGGQNMLFPVRYSDGHLVSIEISHGEDSDARILPYLNLVAGENYRSLNEARRHSLSIGARFFFLADHRHQQIWVNACMNTNVFCWRFTDIFELEANSIKAYRVFTAREFIRTNRNDFDPRSLLGAQFIQLAFHNGKLPTENYRTDYAARSDYSGQANHPSIAAIYPINKGSFGYGLLLVGSGAIFGGIFLSVWGQGCRTSFRWFNCSRFDVLSGRVPVAFGILLIGGAVVFDWQANRP
jgi:hypothetical protein